MSAVEHQNPSKLPPEDIETFYAFIKRTLKNVFLFNLPMQWISELPRAYMYVVGFLAYCLWFGFYFYFAYLVYDQAVNSKHMSLSNQKGYCTAVERPISGNFLADKNGNWAGSSSFDYSRAIYDVRLVDSSLTQSDYELMVEAAADQLGVIGNAAVVTDFSLNLIVYLSWQLSCDQRLVWCQRFRSQTFTLSADAKYVFQTSHLTGTFSNQYGNSATQMSYDLANSLQRMEIEYAAYNASDTSKSIFNPTLFGYDTMDGSMFKLQFDVRTFSDAFAVGHRYLHVVDLVPVHGSRAATISYNGFSYFGQFYVDVAYHGMDAIFCIQNLNGIQWGPAEPGSVNELCFLIKGSTVGLPLFMHYGNVKEDEVAIPDPCWCQEGYAGHEPYCSQMDIVSGFLFFNVPQESLEDQLLQLLEIVIKNGDMLKTNKMAYNATWASVSSNDPSSVSDIYKDPDFLYDSYQFCNSSILNNVTCSIITINSFGSALLDRSLTEHMYLMENGSCTNIFEVPHGTVVAIRDTVPAQFFEQYYECTKNWLDAFVDAVGIALGTVSAIVPIILLLVLPFMYLWLNFSGHAKPREKYSKEEKDLAMEYLVIKELRERELLRTEVDSDDYHMQHSVGWRRRLAKKSLSTDIHQTLGVVPPNDNSNGEPKDSRFSGNMNMNGGFFQFFRSGKFGSDSELPKPTLDLSPRCSMKNNGVPMEPYALVNHRSMDEDADI